MCFFLFRMLHQVPLHQVLCCLADLKQDRFSLGNTKLLLVGFKNQCLKAILLYFRPMKLLTALRYWGFELLASLAVIICMQRKLRNFVWDSDELHPVSGIEWLGLSSPLYKILNGSFAISLPLLCFLKFDLSVKPNVSDWKSLSAKSSVFWFFCYYQWFLSGIADSSLVVSTDIQLRQIISLFSVNWDPKGSHSMGSLESGL